MSSIYNPLVTPPQAAASAQEKGTRLRKGRQYSDSTTLKLLGFCPQALASLDDQVPKKEMRLLGICLDKSLCRRLHFPAMIAETVTILVCGTSTNSTGIHTRPPSSWANS
jgi:hypothetical protein